MSLTFFDSIAPVSTSSDSTLNERLLEILKDAVGRSTSARSLSDKLGHSHNYVRRLFSGEIPLQMSTLLDMLQHLGLPPRIFFDQVFEGLPTTDPVAVLRFYREGDGLPRDPFLDEVGPRIKALADRTVDPDAAVESRRDELDRLEDQRFEHGEEVKFRLELIIVELLEQMELPKAEYSVPSASLADLSSACAIWATIQRTTGYQANCCDMYVLALPIARLQRDAFVTGVVFQKATYLLGGIGASRAAFHFLDQATEYFLLAGSQEKLGQVLVDRGVLLGQVDEHVAAARCFVGALKLLPRSATRNRASALSALSRATQEEGKLEAALEYSRQAIDEYGVRRDIIAAQIRSIYGKLAMELGHFEESERAFLDAIEIFEEVGDPSNIALSSLDYSRLLLCQDRLRDLGVLADKMFECLKFFRSNKIADAALMEFIRTAKWGELTRESIQEIKRRLLEAA